MQWNLLHWDAIFDAAEILVDTNTRHLAWISVTNTTRCLCRSSWNLLVAAWRLTADWHTITSREKRNTRGEVRVWFLSYDWNSNLLPLTSDNTRVHPLAMVSLPASYNFHSCSFRLITLNWNKFPDVGLNSNCRWSSLYKAFVFICRFPPRLNKRSSRHFACVPKNLHISCR